MNYFAIAMIISSKEFILDNDFVSVLEHLQNVSETINLSEVLKTANELFYEFMDQDFKQQSILTKEILSNPPRKEKNKWMSSMN